MQEHQSSCCNRGLWQALAGPIGDRLVALLADLIGLG